MATPGKLYFKGKEVHFGLPKSWKLLAQAEPKDVPAVANLTSEVKKALESPMGTKPLRQLVPATGDVVIISEDQTRPSPVGAVVEPLANMLNGYGVKDDRIKVIMAMGTHRIPNREEIKDKLGPMAERLEVFIHDPDDTDNLVLMGMTKRDTPAWINRRVAEAGLSIAIGTSNPHYFAGYSGGAKIVLPGVSGRETIVHNHVMVENEKARQGIMDGNPIWEDMLETARIANLGIKIDLVLNTDLRVYKLFAGETEQVQRAAVKTLLEVYGLEVPKMADITLTSGYPLESNLIQSGKAVLLANEVTKDGGAIVLLSALSDGAGPLLYETLKEKPKPQTVIQWIAAGKASPTGGPIAFMFRTLLKKKTMMVVSDGMTREQIEDMDMAYAASIEDAIEKLTPKFDHPDVIISPVGGSTFPFVKK